MLAEKESSERQIKIFTYSFFLFFCIFMVQSLFLCD